MEGKGAKEMKRKQHERRSNEITVCDDVTCFSAEDMERDPRGSQAVYFNVMARD